jgi:hypothetical protein
MFFDNFEADTADVLSAGLLKWNVTAGSIDVLSAGNLCGPAGSYSHCVDLDGTGKSAGTIESKQTFGVGAGVYRLTFDLAGANRKWPGSESNTVTVSFGEFFSEDITLLQYDPFQTFTRDINILGPGLANITFNHHGADWIGLLLDNVSLSSVIIEVPEEPNVIPTPEPASWALLGAGLSLVAFRLRRRAASQARGRVEAGSLTASRAAGRPFRRLVAGLQYPFLVDSNPVVGEAEVRLRLGFGHMAGDAVGQRRRCAGERGMGCCIEVTACAAGVVVLGSGALQLRVRVVASEAGERALAFAKAAAFAEIGRLVAHVPGVGEIEGAPGAGGQPVAVSAEVVDLGGLHSAGVGDKRFRLFGIALLHCGDVLAARAVASLAAHAELGRAHLVVVAETHRARRVALETGHDRGGHAERIVNAAEGLGERRRLFVGVSGCERHAARG